MLLTAIETDRWTDGIEHSLSLHRKNCLIFCCSQSGLLEILVKELTSSSSGEEYSSNLLPTLARCRASRNTRVVYLATLAHFRAFFSSQNSVTGEVESISIIGLPDLHLVENQFSAQSISRSLAIVVDSKISLSVPVAFFCPGETSEHWLEDETEQQRSVWERKLPVLGSSSRSGEDKAVTGRTIMLGEVFAQWCEIVKADYHPIIPGRGRGQVNKG